MGNSCRDVKVPEGQVFLCNYVKYGDVVLEFGHHISFVALVITEMISELHLRGKAMLRPVRHPSPKYRERLLSSVTKSNTEM